jgi:hypothetical protein
MEPDVQLGLHNWLSSLMFNDWGEGNGPAEGELEFDGKTLSRMFAVSQVSVTLGKYLPPGLVLKIITKARMNHSTWDAWPHLDENELKECFQAGAAEFFFPDEPIQETAKTMPDASSTR